jgi:hypothetical protein
MIHLTKSLAPAVKFSILMGFTLATLFAIANVSLADYVPPGGKPPSGGSTTSGMRL